MADQDRPLDRAERCEALELDMVIDEVQNLKFRASGIFDFEL